MLKQILIFFCACLVIQSSGLPLLWPEPQQITSNASAPAVKISPCDVRYIVESPLQLNIESIINWYLDTVFKCTTKSISNYSINIVVPARTINLPLEASQDAYSLVFRTSGRWELSSSQYTGFLRGFETFSQVFEKVNNDYYINGIPIIIDDQPDFKWRGLMIDSSRHFLPVAAIKKTIDGLMFNKMNILHWHIIDEDSFPMEIPSIPELSSYGKVGGTYSQNQVSQIIAYAKSRGVRVVVQIDTPAHTQSWGRSQKYKDMIINCNNVYSGQFDPTLNLTYSAVNEVMKFINEKFQDPYVHFGGDQTSDKCWDLKPSIKQWMAAHNISNYKQLSTFYRKQQKALWRKLTPTKKAIYWANQAIDLALDSDDVLQWWGLTANLNRLVNRTNEVILSNYDLTYLDVGFGNRNGKPYQSYIKWRDVYKFNPKYPGVNVIGGETCMWSELSNSHTHDQKVWTRTSVLGERLWKNSVNLSTNLQDIARRLLAHTRRLQSRGYKTSPVTVQICQEKMSICF